MVDFLSQVGVSLAGFVATILLIRILGQSVYGTYVVGLSVLSWMLIAGKSGFHAAVRKRVSEVDDENYVFAGLLVQVGIFLLIATVIWLARSYIDEFVGVKVTGVLILILAARLGLSLIRTVLEGQHLVHVSSLLAPAEWLTRSIAQVALVLSGFGIMGAFGGYAIGIVVATVIGIRFVTVPRTLPTRRAFDQLTSFAKYSWLNSVRDRAYKSMDTIILAFFVSNGLIAVYEVAWNLASLFAIFGTSIGKTLFPAISKQASEEQSTDEIAELLRVSLAYSGLFVVPGIVGSALVGDVVLSIYGPGFPKGYYVLLLLAGSKLLYGYMGQFLTVVGGVDRPDLTFYLNAAFLGTNLGLNVLLTWQYGWIGAAVATTVSAGVGVAFGYHFARQLVPVMLPTREVVKQFVATVPMAVVVLAGRLAVGDSLPVVIVLVGIGATVYFAGLYFLSAEFRKTVRDNLPFEVPEFV